MYLRKLPAHVDGAGGLLPTGLRAHYAERRLMLVAWCVCVRKLLMRGTCNRLPDLWMDTCGREVTLGRYMDSCVCCVGCLGAEENCESFPCRGPSGPRHSRPRAVLETWCIPACHLCALVLLAACYVLADKCRAIELGSGVAVGESCSTIRRVVSLR